MEIISYQGQIKEEKIPKMACVPSNLICLGYPNRKHLRVFMLTMT